MRQELAERVLARVMNWDAMALGQECASLNRLAILKYDEYQQYLPGQKFIESLGLWLRQFMTESDRDIAYAWIKSKLVFISNQEMRQLIESAYQDFVRPILLEKAAAKLGCPPVELARISESAEFKSVRRRSLFLGLSDGSRMDVFRRSAGLDNEQVWQAYEIGNFKATSFLKDLREHEGDDASFENVFLVDDFTASGTSYFRMEGEEYKGKIHKALEQIEVAADGFTSPDCQYFILLYVATERALSYLRQELDARFQARGRKAPTPIAIYTLAEETAVSLSDPRDVDFLKLVLGDDYYRSRPMDSHELKGKTTDMKSGYAGCGLPVVLVHNTPNNSIYLLWANEPNTDAVRGLFPRVTRHKDA